jgi:acylphosphatase
MIGGRMREKGSKSGEGARRLEARFEGRVQGVGFRYTAVHIAQNFAVAGYVRNEPDGSVTVVAEGAEVVLVDFVRALKSSHLGRYVTNESISWSPARKEFAGFTVRFGP